MSTDDKAINLSIFGIQKLLSCAVGDIKNAKKLRNGSVLIEVKNKRQADAALSMTNWVSQTVKVTPHRSLNSSRGIIRCREFRDCDDVEVLNALSAQGVTSAKRMLSKRNNVLVPTNTFILNFDLPTPPKVLKAAYMKIDVEPYIPNPLRCYNCQHYGHGKATCNHKAVCAQCSQEGHQDTECKNPPHCANCNGNHSTYSKDCPEWTKQKEITQIKFEKNISFGEARKIVDQRASGYATLNGNTQSYAKVTALKLEEQPKTKTHTQTLEIATQTDLTWPLESKMPIAVANVTECKQTASSSVQTEVTPPANSTTPTTSSTTSTKTNSNQTKQIKPGPASSKGPDKSTIKPNSSNRPPKGAGDLVKLSNKFNSLDEMAMDLGGVPDTSPNRAKHK